MIVPHQTTLLVDFVDVFDHGYNLTLATNHNSTMKSLPSDNQSNQPTEIKDVKKSLIDKRLKDNKLKLIYIKFASKEQIVTITNILHV